MMDGQHPLTLAFRDEAVERDYLTQSALRAVPHYRIATALLAVGSVGAWFADAPLMVTAGNLAVVHTVKLAFLLPCVVLLCLVGALPLRWFRVGWQPALALMFGAPILTQAAIGALLPDPGVVNVYTFQLPIVILTVAGCTAISLRFVYATSLALVANLAQLLMLAARWPEVLAPSALWIAASVVIGALAAWQLEQRDRRAFTSTRLLAAERARSERLLQNVLPGSVAERLKDGARVADHFAEATVLFADIVGFTALTERLPPAELLAMLDAVFSDFDDLAAKLGLEKIKTIGDAYMVVGGVPRPRVDHAAAMAEMALGMGALLQARARDGGQRLSIRVGIHSGPVVAGVIGKSKLLYDLWGDTVNTASRLESHGVADEIQVSEQTAAYLRGPYELAPRGSISVKGKGELKTWLLVGRATVTMPR